MIQSKQCERILAVMKDHGWWALRELSALTNIPEASLSAQLRNLRKEAYGAHVVVKRYRDGWEYRLVK